MQEQNIPSFDLPKTMSALAEHYPDVFLFLTKACYPQQWQKDVIWHHINNNTVTGIKLLREKVGITLTEAKEISDELMRNLINMKLVSEEKLLTHFFTLRPNKFSGKQQLILEALRRAAETFQDNERENVLVSFDKKLDDYAKEINVDKLTLDDLICSHRRLREANQQNHQQWLEVLKKAREEAFDEAKKYALEHDFLSREKLKKMTLQELSKLLYESDDD